MALVGVQGRTPWAPGPQGERFEFGGPVLETASYFPLRDDEADISRPQPIACPFSLRAAIRSLAPLHFRYNRPADKRHQTDMFLKVL